MSANVIEVRGVGKRYELGGRQERGKTFRDVIAESGANAVKKLKSLRPGAERKKTETLWALKDLNFDVRQGEVVGVIGRNGAGKSTLLKVLSRITEPTEGYIDLWGRVGSLLEVGTGFHPELSGRENIYLNGAILGMRRQEIDAKFDEIVEFAEVERFIDTPVKHYSSGMYLRLAFAVAAHLEPEILVVDEVLAVGDASFQAKCIGRMSEVAHAGRTVLFVSHNLAAISRLCNRVVWLDRGQVVEQGPTEPVVDRYLNSAMDAVELRSDLGRRADGQPFWPTDAVIQNAEGRPIRAVRCGEELRIAIGYETAEAGRASQARVRITFTDKGGTPLFACNSGQSRAEPLLLPSSGTLICRFPRLPLAPDVYTVNLRCRLGSHDPVVYDNILQVQVTEGDFFRTGKLPERRMGSLLVDHTWGLAEEPIESRVAIENA